MSVSSEELEQRLHNFKEGLKQAGIKLTHQRLEVFRELAKTGDHPDTEEIFNGVRKRVSTLSLDTVYRTLWLLLDLKLISVLGLSRESTRFDANLTPHHHFVCAFCGLTRDFYSAEFDHLKMPTDVEEFGCMEHAQVEIKGICWQCKHKRDKTNNQKRRTS